MGLLGNPVDDLDFVTKRRLAGGRPGGGLLDPRQWDSGDSVDTAMDRLALRPPSTGTDDTLARIRLAKARGDFSAALALENGTPYAAGVGDVRNDVGRPPPPDGWDTAGGLLGSFASGLVHGAADMVVQPLAQLADLGQVIYGVTTGGRYDPHWFSSIGQDYAGGGMDRGDVFARAVLQSNLVTGVGLSAYDMTGSAMQGNWDGVAKGAGGLVGGYAAAKRGQTFFAPERGAKLGVFRKGAEKTVVDPQGRLPELPAGEAGNFMQAEPVSIAGRTLRRVFDQGGANANGRYWGEKEYRSASDWRNRLAVLDKWNKGTLQTEWRPGDGYAWGGRAAPQLIQDVPLVKLGENSRYHLGWARPGGDYQFMIPDARTVIPTGELTMKPTPWSR